MRWIDEHIKGIITVFDKIGGNRASIGRFLSKYVPTAPIRVATAPNTTSHTTHPVIKFASKQPIASPGIADGVNTAKMQSTSDNRTCTAPEESPKRAETKVSAT